MTARKRTNIFFGVLYLYSLFKIKTPFFRYGSLSKESGKGRGIIYRSPSGLHL
nr:MAG TPA: hypothetical protein [Bacteriophage sp.]